MAHLDQRLGLDVLGGTIAARLVDPADRLSRLFLFSFAALGQVQQLRHAQAGGLAVIAHPARYAFTPTEEYALFTEFIAHGGRGVEVVTGSHSDADRIKYADMALEFDLLLHFASHPGHVFSRSQLLSAVWGYSHDGYEHTVTTHINRLRAKLEAEPADPRLLLTEPAVGYRLAEPGEG